MGIIFTDSLNLNPSCSCTGSLQYILQRLQVIQLCYIIQVIDQYIHSTPAFAYSVCLHVKPAVLSSFHVLLLGHIHCFLSLSAKFQVVQAFVACPDSSKATFKGGIACSSSSTIYEIFSELQNCSASSAVPNSSSCICACIPALTVVPL